MNSKPMSFAPATKHSAAGILALCVASGLTAGQPAWAQTASTGATSAPTSATSTGTTAGTTSGTTATTTGTTTGSTAATPTTTSTTATTTTTATTSSFQSGSFATFAGSGSNARALFTSLRTGTPTTLTTDTTTGTGSMAGAGSHTFTPTTGAMGTGNVRIALALAQDSLARQGVTSPTPQQINAALNGGTITTGNPPRVVQMPGVLALRSQGMGWGRVAQTLGVKLGPVMAASRSSRTSLAALHRDDHHERHEAEHRIARVDDRDGARHQLAQSTSRIDTRASTAVPGTPRASAQRIVTTAGTGGTTRRGEWRDGHAARGIVTAAGAARPASGVRTEGASSHGTRVALAAPSRGIVTAAGTPATVVTAATSGAMQVRANAISGSGGSALRSESHGGGGGAGGGRGR